MHRAILVSQEPEIEATAIMLAGQRTASVAQAAVAAVKTVEKSVATAGGGATAANSSQAPLVGRTVADVERELILNTLDHCLGNRTHAANILGISIRTLRNKLKEYGDTGVAVPGGG